MSILRKAKEFAEVNGLTEASLYDSVTEQYCLVGLLGKQMGLNVEGDCPESDIYNQIGSTDEAWALADVIVANYPRYDAVYKRSKSAYNSEASASGVIWRFNDDTSLDERIAMLDKAAVEFESRI